VFSTHFYVTTSGFFSDPALQCCIQEIGIDRVMFSIDWPYASNTAGVQWMQKTWLNDADKAKIFSGNAQAVAPHIVRLRAFGASGRASEQDRRLPVLDAAQQAHRRQARTPGIARQRAPRDGHRERAEVSCRLQDVDVSGSMPDRR